MKKTYSTPEVEVSAVSAQDILNASEEAVVYVGNDLYLSGADVFALS